MLTDRKVILLENTSSTNDLAKQAALEGAPTGQCWVAERQTKGRGRRKPGPDRREWYSPPGCNLYLTVLVRPSVEASKLAPITLAVAAEICEGLRRLADLDVGVKWPNDLLVGPKKLAGILTESISGRSGIEGLAIGLGLNVNLSIDQLPDELEATATSLYHETGRVFDRLRLVWLVRDAVASAVETFERAGDLSPFLNKFEKYDQTRGRRVEFEQSGEWVEGRAEGIETNGTLRVRTDGGTTRIRSGEIQWANGG